MSRDSRTTAIQSIYDLATARLRNPPLAEFVEHDLREIADLAAGALGAELLKGVTPPKSAEVVVLDVPPIVTPVDRAAREVLGEAIAPGVPNTEDRGDGQQKGYAVLTPEERQKGHVRPVRQHYKHVGRPAPKNPLRDLTDDERARYANSNFGYIKFEAYPESERPVSGRYWTQKSLDRIGAGCGTITKMGIAFAETYARDPSHYSGTFCCGCGAHWPVGKDGEFIWDDGSGQRVGT